MFRVSSFPPSTSSSFPLIVLRRANGEAVGMRALLARSSTYLHGGEDGIRGPVFCQESSLSGNHAS